ncbi:MAG: metal ABC transporter permease [Rubrimonas sp.]
MDGSALLASLVLAGGWNTALVTSGAALFGAAAGAAGCFSVLRRRALASDALAHATLPGVMLAFIAQSALGSDPRWLPGLLAGAALAALTGLACLQALGRHVRLHEDAAIGAVLSVFFGLGVILLSAIQAMGLPGQAGLGGFVLGQTAGMLAAEAQTIAIMGGLTALAVFVLRRPMALVCFDPVYAATVGIPVRRIEFAILALTLAVIVTGLKIVGLVLVVALLIIPPVAARFWTDSVGPLIAIAAAVGAGAGWLGAAASAAAPRAPTGALIVLAAFTLFVMSMLIAPRRGIVGAWLRTRALRARLHRGEELPPLSGSRPLGRSASIRALRREGMIDAEDKPTPAGLAAARADDPAAQGLDGPTPPDARFRSDEFAALDARLTRGAPR